MVPVCMFALFWAEQIKCLCAGLRGHAHTSLAVLAWMAPTMLGWVFLHCFALLDRAQEPHGLCDCGCFYHFVWSF